MEGWLYQGRERSGVDPWELLKGFVDRADRVLHLCNGFVPEADWLDDTETLTYLHSTVFGRATASASRKRRCISMHFSPTTAYRRTGAAARRRPPADVDGDRLSDRHFAAFSTTSTGCRVLRTAADADLELLSALIVCVEAA